MSKSAIKTPFLRYFLLVYGAVSLQLHPLSSGHNRLSGYLRLVYNLLILLIFNWIYSLPSLSRETSLAIAFHRKPLVRLWLKAIDGAFVPLFTGLTFYSVFFGPEVILLLDSSHFYDEHSISKRKSKLLIVCCLVFDLGTFYWSRLYVFTSSDHPIYQSGNGLARVKLLMQLIAHMRAAVFFRLLTYGKWATWQSLKRLKMSSEKEFSADKRKLRHLVRFNKRLNLLLSFPLLVQILFFSVISIWTICFNELFSVRQAIFFLLPAVNILLVDLFSKRIINELKAKLLKISAQIKVSFLAKNRLSYWQQAVDIYSADFHFTLFSIAKVDRQFSFTLSLLIAYYAMLINQTS